MTKGKKKRIKWNIDLARQAFEDGGCILLSTEYINSHTKMDYICECGRKSVISLDKFKQGRRCRECANKRVAKTLTQPYSKVLEDFQSNNYTLLTNKEDYVNAQQHINYICPNGHKARTTYSDFKSGVRCRTCNGSERHTLEFVRNVFEEGGCELLVDEYINAQTKMWYRCDCGNVSEINYNNFVQGKRCDKCARVRRGEKNKHTYEYVDNYFKENDCILLTQSYENVTQTLTYVCKCHRIGYSTFNTFRDSKQCKQCSFDSLKSSVSTDEMKIERRHIKGYKEWIKRCYQRDNYTCQCCGQRGGKLNAHHKDGYHWCEERRLDDSNSVTLCENCHLEFHANYGRRNNTESQYIEFETDYKSKLLEEF